jgi:hypothetical protein
LLKFWIDKEKSVFFRRHFYKLKLDFTPGKAILCGILFAIFSFENLTEEPKTNKMGNIEKTRIYEKSFFSAVFSRSFSSSLQFR